MAFPCVSSHPNYVDRADHVHRPTVADPLELSRDVGIGRSDWPMGVPGHGSREHSGLPGDSSTWAVGCPWTIPLVEASHVYRSFADNTGMDG